MHKATQQIRFCTSSDGVRIAYATTGSGPLLVKVANWLTHLEFDWASPVWRHWLAELSLNRTLVRYDERGCGLSDWNAADLSFEFSSFPTSRALREMRRMLVPGGTVAVCVFGVPSAYNAALAEGLARHADDQVAKRSLAPFALADAAVLRGNDPGREVECL